MAKKKKTVYVCQECGYDTAKWMGKCPGCGAWNTMAEEIVAPAAEERRGIGSVQGEAPQPIGRIAVEDLPRFSTGSGELDRVLGGGVIPGSMVLIVGDPGVGKSSLTLRVSADIARAGRRVLYVTGEESARQIRMRADRLQAVADDLLVVSETNLDAICAHVEREKPALFIIDSIQTMMSDDLTSAPGSVSQVRDCAAQLTRLAKQQGVAVVMIGHVTKEGALAGPRILEHMVDTVLYFEGDSHSTYRLIRAIKNRFGAVNELGVFGMTDRGLKAVTNPSALFLSQHADPVSGSCVLITQEGTRPLLVEIQALVDQSAGGAPRRLCVGLDPMRLSLLLAVLNRHAGIQYHDQDVFLNAVGGVRITEPAADMAVVLAVLSSLKNRPLPQGLAVFGELGLAGEVRPSPRGQERLREALKLGFSRVICPKANAPRKPLAGLEVIAVERIDQAIAHAWD